MNILEELKLRYAETLEMNSNLPKNQRRYTEAFNLDIIRYLRQDGDKAALAQWLGIDSKSLNKWTRQIPKHSEFPNKASVFLKVPNSRISGDSEINITYPSGVVLRLPLKI